MGQNVLCACPELPISIATQTSRPVPAFIGAAPVNLGPEAIHKSLGIKFHDSLPNLPRCRKYIIKGR